MKTTTIRLDDDLMEWVEGVARHTGRAPSDLMRSGIRDYLGGLARGDDKIRKIRDDIARRRIAEQTTATRRKLGIEPVESPSDSA